MTLVGRGNRDQSVSVELVSMVGKVDLGVRNDSKSWSKSLNRGERKREYTIERESECVCVCVRERERERKSLCV